VRAFSRRWRGRSSASCEANLPPEPLATPDPVLNSTDHVRLTVSFVLIDGRVYGPLVLEAWAREKKFPRRARWWMPSGCGGIARSVHGAPTERKRKLSSPPRPMRHSRTDWRGGELTFASASVGAPLHTAGIPPTAGGIHHGRACKLLFLAHAF